ncbi:MAG: glycoside hydrolase family 13 protein [Clostridiales Family XIII bacterium]|jgi:glycosidase|nr:glycoside hydrolase family 13 protein [Clostridiales Family XIII bacterium]
MNEIICGGLTVRDNQVVHESAKYRYRSPLGAVPAGTAVRIGLHVGIPYHSVWLTVHADGESRDIEMLKDPGYGEFAGGEHGAAHVMAPAEGPSGGTMLHAMIHTPSHASVVWYWFRIDTGGSSVYYGAEPGNNAGVGKVFLNPPTAFQLTVFEPSFRTPDWAKSAIMYQIFPDRFRRSAKNRVESGLGYHHGMGRTDMWLHDDWGERPEHRPLGGQGHYMPLDLFGGDIPGITESLGYLKGLGVSLIYLNPIFESYSNHRYNTGDYLKIDPTLGTDGDFAELVERAGELGIKVILDGVFSHTGDDSVYFNKYGRYGSVGAYQSEESPYHSWYTFSEYPERYKSWWGFDTLPEVDELRQDWIGFIIEGEGSVLKSWIGRGAAGYRLDVADELPDDTISRMRRVLKDADPEAFLLGEVWEDATTKQSYNVGRRYALGGGLDSVMNYPFANHTADFLLGRIDASAYRRFLVSQSQNYPKEMYYALMNLLSSHDVARIRTLLATGEGGRGMSRERQAEFAVSAEDDGRGAVLVRCAAALQYSLPGIPSIYYGDEAGMHGLLDPFNRGTFPWEGVGCDAEDSSGWLVDGADGRDGSVEGLVDGADGRDGSVGVLVDGADGRDGSVERLVDEKSRDRNSRNGACSRGSADIRNLAWYRALGALRSTRRVLRSGGALFYSTNGDVIGVLRYCLNGVDAFGAPAVDEMLLTVVNPDPEPRRIVIDLRAESECLTPADLNAIRELELTHAVRLLSSTDSIESIESASIIAGTDAGEGAEVSEASGEIIGGTVDDTISNGLLDISVPPHSAEIYEIEWE